MARRPAPTAPSVVKDARVESFCIVFPFDFWTGYLFVDCGNEAAQFSNETVSQEANASNREESLNPG
jgi:hypothetical protein